METTRSAIVAAFVALIVTVLQYVRPDLTEQWTELGRLILQIVTLLLGMYAGLQSFTPSQIQKIQSQGKRF